MASNELGKAKYAPTNAMSISHGSPYATAQQRRNRLRGLKDAIATAWADPFMAGLEYLVPDAGYTPGELRSSPKDRIRGDRFAWEDYMASQDQDYQRGATLGTGMGSVVNPAYDLPLGLAARVAPLVRNAMYEGMTAADVLSSGRNLMANEIGAIGDVERLERAKRLFPYTGYHGTGASDIKSFDLSRGGESSKSIVGKLGVSISDTPEVANEFASRVDIGGNVLPLRFRFSRAASLELPPNITNEEVAATVVDAWDNGYDMIHFKNYTTPGGESGKDFILLKSPNQVRSTSAKFDPKKLASADILAGTALAGIGTGYVLENNEGQQRERQ